MLSSDNCKDEARVMQCELKGEVKRQQAQLFFAYTSSIWTWSQKVGKQRKSMFGFEIFDKGRTPGEKKKIFASLSAKNKQKNTQHNNKKHTEKNRNTTK